jgi:hypothetical protein
MKMQSLKEIIVEKLSSEIPDVSVNVFYDHDVAQMQFEDNFEHFDFDRENFYLFFKDGGDYSLDKTYMTMKAFLKLCPDMKDYLEDDFDLSDKSTLEQEYNLETMLKWVDMYKSNWRGVIEEIEPVLKKLKMQSHVSKGYSQGDVKVVFASTKVKTSVIDSLIWDSEIAMTVDVDGENYNIHEYESWNSSEYDKDDAYALWVKAFNEIAKNDEKIKEYLDFILREVKKQLPKHPS